MAEELIISISGMRGIIGENLSPSIAAEYASAFGSYIKRKSKSSAKLKVCIGRDSRPSGEMIESAVASGLCAVGVDVVLLGIVTTPCVGIMIRELDCAGGIVITASHNPIAYNGIKLLLDDGIAPPIDIASQIKQSYFDKDFDLTASIDCGHIRTDTTTDSIHIEKVKKICNVTSIQNKKLKVVLDSVNGAGGRIGKDMLEQLGCEVVGMNLEQTGIFAHTPEPTKENLVSLCAKVKEVGADIGFAQDPDADRLAIVDSKGEYIGEEFTLALAAKLVFSRSKGKAAANLSTSRMIDVLAKDCDSEVIRTPVGEANVAGAMVANGCIIGGEGNGGVIDLRVGPVRDSLVAMALVLDLMAEQDKSIDEIVADIPTFIMQKEKFKVDKDKIAVVLEKAKEVFAGATIDTRDGYRFDFDDGWIHLRGSNTEPIMRIIAEGDSYESLEKYMQQAREICAQVLAS